MIRGILIFVIVLSQGCDMSKRYKMPNALGGDGYIDVTNLVNKKGYRPIYCGPQNIICALINPKPMPLRQDHECQLKTELKNWVKENKPNVDTNDLEHTSIINRSIYKYSYLITYHPVDVYKTEVIIGNDTIKAFFRTDKGSIMTPYDDDGWVIF